jgi:hypothetical protein
MTSRRDGPPTLPERPAPDLGDPDRPTTSALRAGWSLLAVFLPLGLALEALHALKVPVYFRSILRRELWTLAHAHGNLLGLLCLAFAALGRRSVPDPKARAATAKLLVFGAWLMPLGFFAGGVLNAEGDPSAGILAVPIGGALLLVALARAALSSRV